MIHSPNHANRFESPHLYNDIQLTWINVSYFLRSENPPPNPAINALVRTILERPISPWFRSQWGLSLRNSSFAQFGALRYRSRIEYSSSDASHQFKFMGERAAIRKRGCLDRIFLVASPQL